MSLSDVGDFSTLPQHTGHSGCHSNICLHERSLPRADDQIVWGPHSHVHSCWL